MSQPGGRSHPAGHHRTAAQHRRLTTPRRPAAPRLLDPILVAWERLDRRRRRIHPARPGALLGVEFRRHGAPDVALADGVLVRHGDPIGELHLDNDRLATVTRETGWSGIRLALADLEAIARWAARQPPGGRPVAFHGAGLLTPFAAWAGFDVRPRRRTALARLDEWYLRWLMARWATAGRGRLARGHGRLRSGDAWISTEALEARFGSDRPARAGVEVSRRRGPRRPSGTG